jgi:hypothetical protein
MRYASLGTASIETPQANRGWANVIELPQAVTKTGKTRSDTAQAKCAISARHIPRSLQSICLETELMTPRLDSVQNRQPPRNDPKYGRI